MRLIDWVNQEIWKGKQVVTIPVQEFNRVSKQEKQAIRDLCAANEIQLRLTT